MVHPDHPRFARPAARNVVLSVAAVLAALLAQLLAASPASAGQVGVTVHIQGSGSTQVVEGSLEDGASGSCNWTSNKDDRVTNSCPRIRNEEAFEAWVWLRPTPSSSPAGHWRFTGWSGCDSTRVVDGVQECAVHSPCCSNVEKSPTAHFDDFVAPTVSAVVETFSTSVERTASFAFNTNEGQTQCRFDSGPLENCASGVSRTFSEGSHAIEVRAIDASGNVSSTSSRTFMVVDTALTGGPSGFSNSRSAIFTYSTLAGTGFDCSLDGAPFTGCPTAGATYTNLSDGTHTFRVRATNGGWFDRIPAVRTWTVDATQPQTTLGSSSVEDDTASFTFGSSEGGSFQCRLTGGSSGGDWHACSSPKSYSGLPDGDYTFEVRAVDTAGNIDPTPASHVWTVDETAPATQIVSGPADGSFVLSPRALFRLDSDDPTATFACSVDAEPVWCGAREVRLDALSRATHQLEVTATDPVGNADATPERRSWTVPLDDRDLTPSRGWTKRSDPKSYLRTYSQASRKGAALTETVTQARRVALVATKAKGAGTVRVFAGKKLLSTVKLAASRTKRKQVVRMPEFSTPFTGTLKVVVTTSGKPVRIDGLGVATTS